jgi:hypothetical protein
MPHNLEPTVSKNMEATDSSEMLVTSYQNEGYHIQKELASQLMPSGPHIPHTDTHIS